MRKMGCLLLAALCVLGGIAALGEGEFRLSSGLQQAVQAGQIEPMDVEMDTRLPFAVFEMDGACYGVTKRLFQKRMTLGDASLWSRAGIEAPAADWTWADFLALADKVRAYRTASGENVYLLCEEMDMPLFTDALISGMEADAGETVQMLTDYKRLCEEGLIWRVGDTQERPGRDGAFLRTEELDLFTLRQSRVVPAPRTAWDAPVLIVARMTVREAGAAQPKISEPNLYTSGVTALDTTLEEAQAAWPVDSEGAPTQEQLDLWLDGLARGVLIQYDEACQGKKNAFTDFMKGSLTAAECARALGAKE